MGAPEAAVAARLGVARAATAALGAEREVAGVVVVLREVAGAALGPEGGAEKRVMVVGRVVQVAPRLLGRTPRAG